MAVPTGRLDGENVFVDDAREASRLHGRFAVGTPVGDALRLSLVEAAWCLAQDRFAVEEKGSPVGLGDLLGRGRDDRVEVDYLCYQDLRERGLLARPGDGPGEFRVWPRGASLKDRSVYAVRAVAERAPVAVEALAAAAERGDVVAVVDEDGAVTHYRVAVGAPEGENPPGDLPAAGGVALHDRILVTEPKAVAAWHGAEFLGTPGPGGLFLSLVEAEALRRRGVLAAGDDVAERGREGQADFSLLLSAYEALRSRGVVVKSGFRFGTHLRGYRGDPGAGHAEWLIHATDGHGLRWSDVSRGVRLAHGVRKSFALAWVRPGAVRFLEMAWFRP